MNCASASALKFITMLDEIVGATRADDDVSEFIFIGIRVMYTERRG